MRARSKRRRGDLTRGSRGRSVRFASGLYSKPSKSDRSVLQDNPSRTALRIRANREFRRASGRVGIRISPHFYNTVDEVDRVMAEIAAITTTRDYADGPSSVVT